MTASSFAALLRTLGFELVLEQQQLLGQLDLLQ
jgi:hypothetical protein